MSAKPIDLIIGSGANINPVNTEIIIKPAAVTTPPLSLIPAKTASRAFPVCVKTSRILLTKKTS